MLFPLPLSSQLFLQLIIIFLSVVVRHNNRLVPSHFGDVGTGVMLQVECLKNILPSLSDDYYDDALHNYTLHIHSRHDYPVVCYLNHFRKKISSKVRSSNSSRKVATQREVKDLTWLTWLLGCYVAKERERREARVHYMIYSLTTPAILIMNSGFPPFSSISSSSRWGWRNVTTENNSHTGAFSEITLLVYVHLFFLQKDNNDK